MKKLITSLAILLIAISTEVQAAVNIIPTPAVVKELGGTFKMNNEFKIAIDSKYEFQGNYLLETINDYTKLNGKLVAVGEEADITIAVDPTANIASEGYTIDISEDGIKATAADFGGVVNSITSILQITFDNRDFGHVNYPTLLIEDAPKYGMRIFMLDSGRQYQRKEFLKMYIRHLAMLKYNTLHWHLTESDGWRIEIKKYPKLTSVGSKVMHKAEMHGYYTQDDIREIIDYAHKFNISIIPEIDVPGHSHAAIEAYPELGCFGDQPVREYQWHSPYLFCGGKEKVYDFLENVLDEVCDLFDTDYIHIGGDEAPKQHWDKCPDCQAMIKKHNLKDSHDLQRYFTIRIAEYLKTKGKKTIVWDDVLDYDGINLPDNIVIHWWNFHKCQYKNYDKALKAGLEIIAGPDKYTYIYGPINVRMNFPAQHVFDMESAYSDNPGDIKNPSKQVIGVSTSMWSDHNGQEFMMDRKVFPRIYALSEQGWSTAYRDVWEDFYKRVKAKYPYLEYMHIDYGPALKEEVPEGYKWE